MANRCDLCDKGRLVGNKVSHSNIKTKMVQHPNLQRVHAKVGGVSRPVIRDNRSVTRTISGV